MKKTISVLLVIFILLASAPSVKAASGDMGFSGGITEGVRLPKATELILIDTAKKKAVSDIVSPYKEILFIEGSPIEYAGQITIKHGGAVSDTENHGAYKVTYTVADNSATPEGISLNRTIVYNVNWARNTDLGQIRKDYTVASWSERIVIDGMTYELDGSRSRWDISILEDVTAAVTYYKGSESKHAVYLSGDIYVEVDGVGDLYGYDCAWSRSETHRLYEMVNYNGMGQWDYEIRPSVSVNKTLRYSNNEPLIISFPGNYQEVFQNESGLVYDIYSRPQYLFGEPTHGTALIDNANAFENLIYVDTSYLAGNWAYEDISVLFAMEILEGNPKMFQPDQLITRSQFFQMLVKAIKLPIEDINVSKNKRKDVENITFPDVRKDRPDYPYIMAAYKAGIAVGKGGSNFCPDDLITLEEAVHTVIKALGLLNLGIEPTNMTPFTDDADVSDWAKKSLYAALRIDLISQLSDGSIQPRLELTKAAGAALINRLIEYMRSVIKDDYTTHIVNYAK